MIPAIGGAMVDPIALWLASFETAPSSAGAGLFLAIWIENWSWLLFIFPILHLLQVFPTGRILTPRWRWLAYLEVAMFILLHRESSACLNGWDRPRPTGACRTRSVFFPRSFWDGFGPIWTVGLAGPASWAESFRSSSGIAGRRPSRGSNSNGCSTTSSSSRLSMPSSDYSQDSEDPGSVLNVLFLLSILLIPVAITMAVLRYRLFDIDLIIRRTLVYALLTGLLGLVYLGSVVLLQSLFRGEGASSLTVAASTLLTTALFAPLPSLDPERSSTGGCSEASTRPSR